MDDVLRTAMRPALRLAMLAAIVGGALVVLGLLFGARAASAAEPGPAVSASSASSAPGLLGTVGSSVHGVVSHVGRVAASVTPAAAHPAAAPAAPAPKPAAPAAPAPASSAPAAAAASAPAPAASVPPAKSTPVAVTTKHVASAIAPVTAAVHSVTATKPLTTTVGAVSRGASTLPVVGTLLGHEVPALTSPVTSLGDGAVGAIGTTVGSLPTTIATVGSTVGTTVGGLTGPVAPIVSGGSPTLPRTPPVVRTPGSSAGSTHATRHASSAAERVRSVRTDVAASAPRTDASSLSSKLSKGFNETSAGLAATVGGNALLLPTRPWTPAPTLPAGSAAVATSGTTQASGGSAGAGAATVGSGIRFEPILGSQPFGTDDALPASVVADHIVSPD